MPPQQQSFGRSYVQQIPVISSLFIAQGVLLLLMGGYFIVLGVFMGNMDQFMPPGAQQAEFQDMQLSIMFWAMGAIGGMILIISILHFVAAFLGFNYKGRVFGIVTMVLGLLSLLSCYCAPTAIGLAVYGMIIYLNPASAKAFQMGKSGMKKQEILSHFPN